MGNIPDPDTCKTHPERKLPVSKAIAPSVVSYQFSCHDRTQHPMYGSGSPHSHDLRSWYLTSGCPLPYQPDRRTSLSARIWLFLLCYCLIGQSLGAGDKKLAKRFAKDICLISAAVILAACIPVYILSGSIIHLFTNDHR